MSLASLQRSLAENDRHVAPFFVLGDPDLDTSLELCCAAVEAGATMLELGLPFSDPVADGPAIQDACIRALAAGTTVAGAFVVMAELRKRVSVPFNLLVYGNLVHARGMERFSTDAVASGASSLLVPDVPLEEGAALNAACTAAGLGTVQLCAPSANEARVRALSAASTAFLYLVGRQGTTGARDSLPDATQDIVRRVVRHSSVPVCVGFGLKEPEHLSGVFDCGAKIAIVGSALAQLIAAASPLGRDQVIETVRAEVARLSTAKSGTRRP